MQGQLRLRGREGEVKERLCFHKEEWGKFCGGYPMSIPLVCKLPKRNIT